MSNALRMVLTVSKKDILKEESKEKRAKARKKRARKPPDWPHDPVLLPHLGAIETCAYFCAIYKTGQQRLAVLSLYLAGHDCLVSVAHL